MLQQFLCRKLNDMVTGFLRAAPVSRRTEPTYDCQAMHAKIPLLCARIEHAPVLHSLFSTWDHNKQ
jgi:hypothetical protein